MLGGKDAGVTKPDATFDYVPFKIYKNQDGTFKVADSFDLQTYAGITVSKTYYVDTNTGNDGNDGLTAGTALLTWNAAVAKADVDRIILCDGSYLYRSVSTGAPTRNIEVVGEGTVYFTSDRTNNLGAWSLVVDKTNTYQSTVAGGEYIARVYDESVLDAFSKPTKYTDRASIDLVEANAGSYYWNGGVIYVHLLSSADPTGNTDIKYYDSQVAVTKDNLTLYYKNINFRPTAILGNATAAGGLKVYFDECSFYSLSVNGLDLFILKDCDGFSASEDLFNYKDKNGKPTNAIEIDCDIYRNYSGATSQASTTHDNCNIVRINGKYHDVYGQCIADTGAGKSWCLGTEVYNSNAGVGFYSTVTMWLDTCHSHDNSTYDLQNTLGNTIYIRNCTLEKGVNDIGGTLATY